MTQRGIICTFESGSRAQLRHTTVSALVVKAHQVLLVKRAAHLLTEPGKWALPAGYVDRGERVEDAVRREVQEETGYQCTVIRVIGILDNPDRPDNGRQNISLVYLVSPRERVQEPDNESSEVRWFSFDNLPPSDEIAFEYATVLATAMHMPVAHLPSF